MRQTVPGAPAANIGSDFPPCRRRKIGRPLFAIWAILSVVWTAGVCYNIYQRVCTQADMSRDVERDLDLVNCTGQQCDASMAESSNTPAESKLDIVSTYIKFGSVDMAEATIGPPAILLVFVLAGIFLMRRREAQAGDTDMAADTQLKQTGG
jgi:hypothetical protein